MSLALHYAMAIVAAWSVLGTVGMCIWVEQGEALYIIPKRGLGSYPRIAYALRVAEDVIIIAVLGPVAWLVMVYCATIYLRSKPKVLKPVSNNKR